MESSSKSGDGKEPMRSSAGPILWTGESPLAAALREMLQSRPVTTALKVLAVITVIALVFEVSRLRKPAVTNDDVTKLVAEADAQFRSGDFTVAARIYTIALSKDLPAGLRMPALVGRGWALTNSGKAAEAVPDFNAALQISPKYAFAFLGRGAAFHQLGRLQESIDDYTEAIRLNPNLIEAYTGRGVLHADRGQRDEAIADMSEAIRRAPRDPRWFVKRGQFHRNGGDIDAALGDYLSAIRLDAESVDGNYGRAQIRISKGEATRALAEINNAIQQHPKSARLIFVRALFHLETDELEESVEDCAEAIRLRKDFAGPYAVRAILEFRFGDFEAALAFARLATELDPKLPQPYHIRGRVLEARQQFAEAIAQFEQAIALNREWVLPVMWHALTKAHATAYQVALDELERAEQRFSGVADSHLMLAWFLATCPESAFRDGPRAVTEAEIALDLSRGSAAALDVLAAANAEVGEFARAVELEAQAMNRTPTRSADCRRMEMHLQDFARHTPCRDYREGI